MLDFYSVQVEDLPTIQTLAQKIWPVTFHSILNSDQIAYMMEMMYSKSSLLGQLGKGHQFYMAMDPDPIGYFSIQWDHPEKGFVKIHKIYLDPEIQKKGYGKKVFHYIEELALKNQSKALILNVNRHNSAIGFYTKLGFEKISEEKIDIGNGFIMDDWVMQKSLIP